MIFTDEEKRIIKKNTKEIARYIADEIQPKLRENCTIKFGEYYKFGDGTYDQRYQLHVNPDRIVGTQGCLVYKFTEDSDSGSSWVSVYSPGFGTEYSFELIRNWAAIKKQLLAKAAKQSDTGWLNSFTV